MGASTQDQICRTVERTVGAAAARKRDCVDRDRGLSCQRRRLSSRDRRHRFSPRADEPFNDRALRHDSPGVRIEISRHAPRDQSPACPAAKCPRTKRNHHPQGSRTQPRRAAFRRVRPRICKGSRKAKITAPSRPVAARSRIYHLLTLRFAFWRMRDRVTLHRMRGVAHRRMRGDPMMIQLTEWIWGALRSMPRLDDLLDGFLDRIEELSVAMAPAPINGLVPCEVKAIVLLD